MMLQALCYSTVLATASMAMGGGPGRSGTVVYVDDSAPPGGDGSSWQASLNDLQAALTLAADPGSSVSEIRIAQGRYVPSLRTDVADPRSATFQLVSGLTIIGGFAGQGAKNPDVQNIEVFETILTGDLNGDGGPAGTFTNQEDNAYHVVTASGTNAKTWLEGVTISGGYGCCGLSQSDPRSFGGGVYSLHGSATFAMCAFKWNLANGGAGAYFEGGAPLLVSCVFESNHATIVNGVGGAALCDDAAVEFAGCIFRTNIARRGGALAFGGGTVIVQSCVFSFNQSSFDYGGAIIGGSSNLTMNDCVFESNNAPNIGGACMLATMGGQIRDCTFIGNLSQSGGAIYLSEFVGEISRCEFNGNAAIDLGEAGALNINYSSMSVSDCDFHLNSAAWGGAVRIADQDSGTRLINCRFTDNQAFFDGGAIYSNGGTYVVSQCAFDGNSSANDGGALTIEFGTPLFDNCLFASNVAHGTPGLGGGGAAIVWAATPRFTNCTFASNLSENGGALTVVSLTGAQIHNSVFWDNLPNQIFDNPPLVCTLVFTTIQGGWTGPGAANVALDPRFVNPNTADYRLMPDSPCIDAANNDSAAPETPIDLSGLPRFRDDPQTPDSGKGSGAIVDMGCYEFQPAAPACPEDCAYPPDGIVAVSDLLEVIRNWGVSGTVPADVDLNLVVDMDDLLAVINHWGPCR